MLIRPLALVTPPDAALWYDSARPLALGCTLCPDLDLCGGLRIAGGVFDCRSLCACARHGKKCSGVCRSDQHTFLRRVSEIDGFTLDNVPRREPLPVPSIPDYVPIIYNGTNRLKALDGGTVAVPLLSLFDRKSGTGRFDSREGLLAFLRLSTNTRIIVTGVDVDRALERWWWFADRPRLIESLRPLGVEMVTAPNYSLFTDVTRHDNLHNMKRIALACAELMAGGMPCALHVNGRTDRDYERWRAYVADREEISLLAFEFTTGTASPVRGAWHRDQLVAIAEQTRRPLHLVVRGGRRHLRQLSAAFASVSVLDADPYVKTKYRQRANFVIGAGVEWRHAPTPKGQPLDDLLRHNIEVARHSSELRSGWLRTDYGNAEAGDESPLLQACLAQGR